MTGALETAWSRIRCALTGHKWIGVVCTRPACRGITTDWTRGR